MLLNKNLSVPHLTYSPPPEVSQARPTYFPVLSSIPQYRQLIFTLRVGVYQRMKAKIIYIQSKDASEEKLFSTKVVSPTLLTEMSLRIINRFLSTN